MPAQSANDVTIPVGGDAYALTADLKKMVESSRLIISVANEIERSGRLSLLGAVGQGPTVARPIYFDRADLSGACKLERTTDGINFVRVTPDTGWTQTGLVWETGWSPVASGTWHELQYRVLNGVCYVNGTATKSSYGGNELMVTLPAGARPKSQFENSYARVFVTGNLRTITSGSGVKAVDISFPVG